MSPAPVSTTTRTLALIHTSPVLVPMFTALCSRLLPSASIFHMVDESLIKNTIAAGSLQKTTIRRLVHQIESAAEAGADAVLVTCSSIGEGVSAAQPLFDLPIVRIDEPMAERAVASGRRIGVLATLETTMAPTLRLLEATAEAQGLERTMVPALCAGAFEAVLAGDVERHDGLLRDYLAELRGSVDVIVLAQASMARVIAELPEHEREAVPIYSSPELAVVRAAEVLRQGLAAD